MAPPQPHPSAYSHPAFSPLVLPLLLIIVVSQAALSRTQRPKLKRTRLSEHRRRSPRQAAAAHGAHRVGRPGAAEWGKRCLGSRRKESRSCPSGPRPADKQASCSTGACARCDGRLSASGTLLDRFYRIGTRCADNGNFVPPSQPAIFLLVVLHTVCRIYSAFLPADIALAPRPNLPRLLPQVPHRIQQATPHRSAATFLIHRTKPTSPDQREAKSHRLKEL